MYFMRYGTGCQEFFGTNAIRQYPGVSAEHWRIVSLNGEARSYECSKTADCTISEVDTHFVLGISWIMVFSFRIVAKAHMTHVQFARKQAPFTVLIIPVSRGRRIAATEKEVRSVCRKIFRVIRMSRSISLQ